MSGVLLRPGRIGLGRRNRISNFTFYLCAAAGGSAASVVAILLASWALISLAIGRLRWRLEPSDLPIVLASVLFFTVIAASNVLHPVLDGDASLLQAGRTVGALLPFVMPLFLVPRMRCSVFRDTLPPAFFGSAIGGILLVPICAVSYLYEGDRVAGFAGNPGPLSVTGLLAAGFSILSLSRGAGRVRLAVGVLGAFGGCLAVVLSGMRGAWPALPVVLLLPLVAQRREIAALWRETGLGSRISAVLGAAGTFACAAYVVAPLVNLRVAAMLSDLSLMLANVDTATSLNMRRAMYEAATEAFAARPWFGYGDKAHWTAIEPYLSSHAFDGFSFSHLHNIVLTVGIDAGVVGLAALAALVAAPLWTAWRSRRQFGGSRRLAAAAVLVVAFLVPGLSNIMFFHDILDAVWVFSISLIAASVPPTGEEIR